MRSVRIELAYSAATIPPLHEAFCESPDLDRELILGGQTVDGVETITSFVVGDPAAYEAVLADRESVLEYELTPAEDGFFLYLRRELGPGGTSLLDSLSRETVVVVPPIEVRSDRTIRMTLVGHPDDLGAVVEATPEGIDLRVRRVGGALPGGPSPLTERQREALSAARELGYYEVPRRNGVEAVADELDCAVSTASGLLRRGEARLVGRAIGSDR